LNNIAATAGSFDVNFLEVRQRNFTNLKSCAFIQKNVAQIKKVKFNFIGFQILVNIILALSFLKLVP
jgi:hypoxanthine-guanine phosphoribosyltransferase